MGDELTCLTELLCCCILLEDTEYTNNMNNPINYPQINRMERNEGSSNGSNGSNEQEYYFDNEGNYLTIVEGEPLLKDTCKIKIN